MDAAMQTTMNRSALSIAVSFALFGASSVALAQVEADKPKADSKPVPKVEETYISDTTYANVVFSGIAGWFDRYPRIPYGRATAYTQHSYDKFNITRIR